MLLTYISLHLINHALAIYSLRLADSALGWSIALWQSLPGTAATPIAFRIADARPSLIRAVRKRDRVAIDGGPLRYLHQK